MRLFISHKSEDKRTANELYKTLADLPGVDVWLDIFELAAGDTLDKILPAIDESDAVILLWSAAASESDWVRKEYEHGRATGRRVIPVLLDRTIPRNVEGLGDLLYVDFWDEEIGLGHLCVSYVAATALERAGCHEELALLRRYEGYVAHAIRNLLIRRTRVHDAKYWSSESREALETVGDAIDDLLDEIDEDGDLFGILDGLTDIVWAMQDRLEELLSHVEIEERLRVVHPEFDNDTLSGCAMGVWQYLATAHDVIERLHSRRKRHPYLWARVEEYLEADDDLAPDSDHSFLGFHDDAWLVINAAYRLEEGGYESDGYFGVDWEAIYWQDVVVRQLIEPRSVIALERHLRRILAEELGVDDVLTADLDYDLWVEETDEGDFLFLPFPDGRQVEPDWMLGFDDD